MEKIERIYLDYAATTPVDERVLQSMLPFFSNLFGNPSSVHSFGQQAEAALEDARRSVAQSLHARPEEIIFTSCGTESDNLALRGAALSMRKKSGASRILISPVEHHAVSHTVHQLCEQEGFTFEYLPVDSNGIVHADEVEAAIRPGTALVSVIYANNEIGSINPVQEIAAVCRRKGVLMHTDAVQAAAHLPMDVERDGVDFLAIGAHKFYGPKGVGALFIRRGVSISPSQTGGKQENGLRAGTHNIPYIIGLAEALRLAQAEQGVRSNRITEIRDLVLQRVIMEIPRSRITGHPTQRLPNHASFAFEGVDGNRLLMMLDVAGFACSSGSACKVGTPEVSEVLSAIGLSSTWGFGSLRVTLGKDTTRDQVEAFLHALPAIVERIRKNV
jgi:cysteine desulfurase